MMEQNAKFVEIFELEHRIWTKPCLWWPPGILLPTPGGSPALSPQGLCGGRFWGALGLWSRDEALPPTCEVVKVNILTPFVR